MGPTGFGGFVLRWAGVAPRTAPTNHILFATTCLGQVGEQPDLLAGVHRLHQEGNRQAQGQGLPCEGGDGLSGP